MRYDAFISYRHTPLDMEIAKKVHVGLETYHVPGAVQKKTGKQKIRRVFRDQEELPIGSDLNENISEALRESEYLIVICSPETPGSYWVLKEIETFIEMHDRQHILAVLIDGEPEQSFPAPLLCDEEGHAVEPLAADVRGATPSERNKKFKTELLRLAAPILGCTYDDLRQRHRERILKRNILIGAVAAGILAIAGTGFGIYNAKVAARMKKLADEKAQLADEKTKLANDKSNLANEKSRLADEKTKLADDILVEFKEKQVNQSRFYAEEAMAQYRLGNLEDAVLIASAGLPSEGQDRPFVAEAEYALATALHAYDSGNEIDFDRILEHDHSVEAMDLDESGRYLTSTDSSYTVYVYDTQTGELKLKVPPETDATKHRLSVIAALANADGLVVINQKGAVRYDYAGETQQKLEFEKDIRKAMVDDVTGTIFCVTSDTIRILELSDLTVRAELRYSDEIVTPWETGFSEDGKWFACAYSVEETEPGRIAILDCEKNKIATAALTGEHTLVMTLTELGNVAVVSTNHDFFYEGIKDLTMDVFSAKDGKKLYSLELPYNKWEMFDFKMQISSHAYDGKNDIVIASDSDVYSIDEVTGEMKAHATLPGSATALALVDGTSTAYICCRNGDILVMDTDDGKSDSALTISTTIASEDMRLINGGVILRERNSTRLLMLKYHEAYDLRKLPDLNASCLGYNVAPNSDYYVLQDRRTVGVFYFYDSEGSLFYTLELGSYAKGSGFYGDRFVITNDREIHLVDPIKGTDKKIAYKDLGLNEKYNDAQLSSDGRRLMTYFGVVGTAVIDLEEERCIYSYNTDKNIDAATLSGDGKYLLFSKSGSPLAVVDIATGERREFSDPGLDRYSTISNRMSVLTCDEAGQYAAMACADGYVRILSMASTETLLKLPLQTDETCFLKFTKDGKHILMQGDDRRVRIYDLTDGACVNFFELGRPISFISEAEGKIAISTDQAVTLLDAESFGKLADVPNAVVYLPKSQTFILAIGKDTWATGYKNYQDLKSEAERQYPGAKLSDEKKVLYNID